MAAGIGRPVQPCTIPSQDEGDTILDRAILNHLHLAAIMSSIR